MCFYRLDVWWWQFCSCCRCRFCWRVIIQKINLHFIINFACFTLFQGFTILQTIAYYHIVTMINMNCALWYINSRAIREASTSLSKCFRRDVSIECTAGIISKYRFLWLNLSELLQTLGNAYARTYATYCVFMFVNITIAVYGALSEIIDHGLRFSFKELGLFVDTIYCSTLLFIFCDCSHNATLQVSVFFWMKNSIHFNPSFNRNFHSKWLKNKNVIVGSSRSSRHPPLNWFTYSGPANTKRSKVQITK